MGKKKIIQYYNNYYKGSYLTDEECAVLDTIIKLSESNGCVEELRNVVYNLTDVEIEQVIVNRSADLIDKKIGALRDEQTTGVAFMYYAKRLVLGDSVGMGKTVELCGLINLLTQEYLKNGLEFRYLLLTQKGLLVETRNKVIKFTGEYNELLWGDQKYVKEFADVYDDGLPFSVVGAHSLINSVHFQNYVLRYRAKFGSNPFDIIIIDESDVVSNTATDTYKNAQFLVKDVDRVIAINATPFESNLRAFFSQINLCDDSLLPAKSVFSETYEVLDYTRAKPRFSGKYKNTHIFESQVRYRYLARTRKGTGATMKDCSAKVIVTPLSKLQRDLLRLTSMPNMVYNCPNYFNNNIEINSDNIPKIGALIKTLQEDYKDEETILIYSRYIKSQDCVAVALQSLGIDYRVLNGETSKEDKNKIITGFKQGKFKALITNVQKGLDFGDCNCCIFYTYDPNPNKMVQFEGRMTRSFDVIGKKVVVLLSEGTEKKTFEKVIASKAEASNIFAGSDFSCVLSLLLENKSNWVSM